MRRIKTSKFNSKLFPLSVISATLTLSATYVQATHSPIVVGIPYEDSCGTRVGGHYRNESTALTAVCNHDLGPEDNSLHNSGAVVVSWQNPTDTKQNNVLIKAFNADAGDRFGEAAIMSGNRKLLLVGAPGEDGCRSSDICPGETGFSNNREDSGAVYSYKGSGNYLFFSAIRNSGSGDAGFLIANGNPEYIKAFNGEKWDNFGAEVHISAGGEVMVVGAPGEDSCSPGPGYTTIGGRVNINKDIGNNYLCPSSVLGNSYRDADNNSASNSGAVYIYRREQITPLISGWKFDKYLKAHNADKGDMFGSALSLSSDGKQLLVGAPGEDNCGTGVGGTGDNPNLILGQNPVCGTGDPGVLYREGQWNNNAKDSGAVYHYAYEGDQWILKNYIKPSNTNAGDNFGSSLSFDNNNSAIIVGAPGEDGCAASNSFNALLLGGNPNTKLGGDNACGSNPDLTPLSNDLQDAGAVYFFDKNNSGNYRQTAYVKATNPDAGDLFGASLFVAPNNTLMVGAPGEDGCGTGIGGAGHNDGIAVGGNPICQGTGITNNDAKDSGAFYEYSIAASSGSPLWAQYIKAPSVQPAAAFGTTVAAATIWAPFDTLLPQASVLVAGSPGYSVVTANRTFSDAGRVFFFSSIVENPTLPTKLEDTGFVNPITDNFTTHSSVASTPSHQRTYSNTLSDFDYQGGTSLGGGNSIADDSPQDCDLFSLASGSTLGDVADFLQCLGKFGVN
ncbi:hypothetical protein AB6D09_006825 [Vibrio cyclitrophicus]